MPEPVRAICSKCGAPERWDSHHSNAGVRIGETLWRHYECGRLTTDGPDVGTCNNGGDHGN